MVRYSIWAGVENKKEPFLGFSLLVCQPIGIKVNWGELGDQELMDWNSLGRVSGGFRGKTGYE